jgi:hypothetical protein
LPQEGWTSGGFFAHATGILNLRAKGPDEVKDNDAHSKQRHYLRKTERRTPDQDDGHSSTRQDAILSILTHFKTGR